MEFRVSFVHVRFKVSSWSTPRLAKGNHPDVMQNEQASLVYTHHNLKLRIPPLVTTFHAHCQVVFPRLQWHVARCCGRTPCWETGGIGLDSSSRWYDVTEKLELANMCYRDRSLLHTFHILRNRLATICPNFSLFFLFHKEDH